MSNEQPFENTGVTNFDNQIEQAKNKIEEVKPQVENVANEATNALNNVNATGFTGKIQQAINSIKEKINSLRGDRIDIDTDSAQLREVELEISKIEEQLQQAKNGEIHLTFEEGTHLEAQLERLNAKKERLEQNNGGNAFSSMSSSTKSLSSSLSGITSKIKNVTKSAGSLRNGFTQINKACTQVNTKIQQMGNGMKQGISHVLRYAMALFSLRSTYTLLSSCANSWLSSQNALAQQMNTNIDYMKNAMGNALAPVIEWCVNLVYKLMKAVQSLIYALFKVNIFANASASSYSSMASDAGSTAKSAKDTAKSLAGVHDEINNVSETDTSGSGSSGSGGTISPSWDLSSLDEELGKYAQKLYDLLKPIVDSWDEYGPELVAQFKKTCSQLSECLLTVWSSFENVITNGTVYKTLELILAIIGDIAEAFSNAWKTDEIGDKLVQNIFNTLNKILNIIDEIAKSTGFQNMLTSVLKVLNTILDIISDIADAFEHAFIYNGNLDTILTNIGTMLENVFNAIKKIVESSKFQEFIDFCSEKLKNMSKTLASIDWDPIINALFNIGSAIGKTALTIIDGLVSVFKWFVEHPTVVEIIAGIAVAIEAIKVAKTVVSHVSSLATGIVNLYNNSSKLKDKLGDAKTAIELMGISAKEAVSNGFNGLKTALSNVGTGLKSFITSVKDTIVQIAKQTAELIANAAAWAAAHPLITATVAAVAAVTAGTIALVNALKGEDPQIKSTEEAYEDLQEAIENTQEAQDNLTDATASYEDAVDAMDDALAHLTEVEAETGLSGEALYQQVQEGTLDYADMTTEQREVYKAYKDTVEAQDALDESTKAVEDSVDALTKAEVEETKASLENSLALASESGNYDDYKKAVVDAYENGEISAGEAQDYIERAMGGMSTASQETFQEDLPTDITDGLEPTQYESAGQKIKNFFGDTFESIKGSVTEKVGNMKEKLSTAWDNIKTTATDVFDKLKTKLGTIWDNIWTKIKSVINSILSGIESFANGIVKGINKVIDCLNNLEVHIPDWVPVFGDKTIGFNIKSISEVSLPRLAKGNVAYDEMVGVFGEYPGAGNNPEITTPQNIMAETFEDTLTKYFGNDNKEPVNITVNVGNESLGTIMLDDLRDRVRRSGKSLEAIVN